MHAVILAGGKGVRLRPVHHSAAQAPGADRRQHSILEIVLHQLAAHGFTSVTLAINHLGQLIRAFVGDGSRWGLEVDYAEETTRCRPSARCSGSRTGCPSTSSS